MSFLVVIPDAVAGAAQNLTGISSSLQAANATAAGATTLLPAAAADEVSAAIASLFGGYAREYQALGAQLALAQEQFVRAVASGGFMYAATEAANAFPAQTLADDILAVINAPTNTLFGRPLIGDGIDGAPESGQAGGAGGFLIGNGGRGGSGAAGMAGGPGGDAGMRVGVGRRGVRRWRRRNHRPGRRGRWSRRCWRVAGRLRRERRDRR
nr:PE family protein [Mycobacterium asiaticum]